MIKTVVICKYAKMALNKIRANVKKKKKNKFHRPLPFLNSLNAFWIFYYPPVSSIFIYLCFSLQDAEYQVTSPMSQTVSFSIQPEVQLRFLNPNDIDEVKTLCQDWFPIE